MEKFPAKCVRQNNGYLLLKNSHISPVLSTSCSEGIKQLRIQNAHIISADFILLDDIFFTSSSAAAKFVSGSSINGKIYWKNEAGVLLKDILDEENK